MVTHKCSQWTCHFQKTKISCGQLWINYIHHSKEALPYKGKAPGFFNHKQNAEGVTIETLYVFDNGSMTSLSLLKIVVTPFELCPHTWTQFMYFISC